MSSATGAAQPVLGLVGPTGAGKSGLALQAAEQLDAKGVAVEIVAVDAFTVYRGMDIGTAKASVQERAAVAHHMVDVLEPEEECTVRWFQEAARSAINSVCARGAVPLLVGGSGLYFRSVVDPLEFPPTDPAVRARVAERFDGDAAAAYAALLEVDADAAARMDPGNLRRAVRALEVYELTGRRFSEWRQAWDRHDNTLYPGLVVLGPDLNREQVAARIDKRTQAMLEAGWLDEAALLKGRKLSTTARQALGYQELFDHLEGSCTLAEAAERITARTRRYAAYQARWFRADPRVRWLSTSAVVEELVRCAL